MEKNVLQWLEKTAGRFPDKLVYREDGGGITFAELSKKAQAIGSAVIAANVGEGPVAVMMGRHVSTIAAFLGVVYSGRPYAPIDMGLPKERLKKIFSTLEPAMLILDRESAEILNKGSGLAVSAGDGGLQTSFVGKEGISPAGDSGIEPSNAGGDGNSEVGDSGIEPSNAGGDGSLPADRAVWGIPIDFPVFEAEALEAWEPDLEALQRVRSRMSELDPLYIIFTSGSSGMPKGVVTAHHSLMNYIQAYTGVMSIGDNEILGCQSPLDYIAAIRDIYVPLLTGASTYIIPKELFMQPEELFRVLNREKITALGWSASALTVLSSLGAFKDMGLETVRKICFSGSVIQNKVLEEWRTGLPNALFINQYGPTETTASCTYYKIGPGEEIGGQLPIGIPYDNYKIYLINEDGKEADFGEEGEICVGGPGLALGYYNDQKRTNEAFIQNPLVTAFVDRVYRTGDIGVKRKDGNLEFHGRRDRQIKYMGHRVELDEIETAAYAEEGLKECAAVYKENPEALWLFYEGEIGEKELSIALRQRLPGFMVPRRVKKLPAMPHLPNGKTDFEALKAETQKKRRKPL